MKNNFKNIILEIEVSNTDIQNKINEFAETVNKLEKVKVELNILSKKHDELLNELLPIIEEAYDKVLKTEKYFMFIKKIAYERTNFQYKKAFDWLYDRVNGTMKKLIDEAKEASKTITRIAPEVSIQKNESVSDIFTKMKKLIKNVVSKIKSKIKIIDDVNKELNKIYLELK